MGWYEMVCFFVLRLDLFREIGPNDIVGDMLYTERIGSECFEPGTGPVYFFGYQHTITLSRMAHSILKWILTPMVKNQFPNKFSPYG